eukprot:TRINITY_DN18342_c0_g1_i1.p1 TRINITY_DN18342_c0_g1~~TRINITY_DN18342_c0_g1_i1.p1  ORF type:complete len:485 (-),score=156.72 TRINITY_DN18342_c0_g1_i1:446-1900(-)
MVLEATVICVDNSEWMRNGDYTPSRFQAQADAVSLICGAKTQSNPENTVGVLTMAGKGVRVLVTPTADLGKILSSLHGVEVAGETNLVSGVQVAQLALKHRQNKNQRQRIVLFAGSPVGSDADTLVRMGKKLKKNNVALDVVSFGGDEDEEKVGKLEALLQAVNSNDNSHLVHIPSGAQVLADVLISSPIFSGDGDGGSGFAAAAAAGAAAAAAAAGGAGGGYDFGVDPNLDPELALALRVSMEEERARQEEAAAKRAADEASGAGGSQGGGPSGAEGEAAKEVVMGEGEGEAAGVAAGGGDEAVRGQHEGGASGAAAGGDAALRALAGGAEPMDDEAALLEEALAMSLAEAEAAAAGATAGEGGQGGAEPLAADAEDMQLELALQMSMLQEQEALAREGGAVDTSSGGGDPPADVSSMLGDASFINSVLASLPGVDPNDPSVRELLASLQPSQGAQPPQGDKPGEAGSGEDSAGGGAEGGAAH